MMKEYVTWVLVITSFLCLTESLKYFEDIERCIVTKKGEEYIGKISETRTGKKCILWNKRSGNREYMTDTTYSDKSVDLAKNYCRNPNSDPLGPWCFFGSKVGDYEYCNIPMCDYVESCKDTESGLEYDGIKDVTKSGKQCEISKEKKNNKCRNPDQRLMPWCFIDVSNEKWEYCNVPTCKTEISQTEYFLGKDNIQNLKGFYTELILDELITNANVKISISKNIWTEDIQKKISVWSSDYSSKCQKNFDYYEYCQTDGLLFETGSVSLTFKCKDVLLSLIIIIPLKENQFVYELKKGPPYIIENIPSQSLTDYIKEADKKLKNKGSTISLSGNGSPFFLLTDNVVPYAVTTDNKVVMTISKFGKGQIGLMGTESFTESKYEKDLRYFFEKVYGINQIRPKLISKNDFKMLNETRPGKKSPCIPLLWNAHEVIGKNMIDLVLSIVQDGCNLIVGVKPWAYHYYTAPFEQSEIKELLLSSGVWPSLEIVYGDLKVIESIEPTLFPLIHLMNYAKVNVSCAVSVSETINKIFEVVPLDKLAEEFPGLKIGEKMKVQSQELYQVYHQFIKSIVPCERNPLENLSHKSLLQLYNMLLLNSWGNDFIAPGTNFYPGDINLDSVSLESVRIKLNLKFNNEKVFVGIFIPANQNVSVLLKTSKSQICFFFVNFNLFDVSETDKWAKWPRTMKSISVKSNGTKIFSNPFGGLLSISCDTNDDKVEVKIENVIRVPIYDRRNGEISKDWSDLKNRKVPWAIVAGDNIVFIIPTIALRNMGHPQQMMEKWDRLVKEEFHLRGRLISETYREIVSFDIQIKYGFMHAGYPIGAFINLANPTDKDFIFSPKEFSKNVYWGITHEIGHNLQHRIFTYLSASEVTNNIFTLAATEALTGDSSWDPKQGWVLDGHLPKMLKYINDRNYSSWESDPFLGLGIYAQLRAEFGWEMYRQLFRRYDTLISEYGDKVDTMTNDEKIQLWIIESSNIVKMNLVPLYDFWAWPITKETEKTVDKYPKFLPDDFLTKLTKTKVDWIIKKYGGEKLVSRKPLSLPNIVGPLRNPLAIEGHQVLEEITVI